MKIKMLTNTNFEGMKFEGKEYDLSETIANRWINNGIAVEVEEIEETDFTEVEYKDMKVKELFAKCKLAGIAMDKEVVNAMSAEEKKIYFIERLEEFDSKKEEEVE